MFSQAGPRWMIQLMYLFLSRMDYLTSTVIKLVHFTLALMESKYTVSDHLVVLTLHRFIIITDVFNQ